MQMQVTFALMSAIMIGAMMGMDLQRRSSSENTEIILEGMSNEIISLIDQATAQLDALGVHTDLHILIDIIPKLRETITAQLDSGDSQGKFYFYWCLCLTSEYRL